MLSSSIAAALFAGFLLASDQLWQQMVVRPVSASTLEAAAQTVRERATPLASPIDYLVLPPPGGEALALREGPGARYATVAGVDSSRELLGTGTGLAPDGSRWVLVTMSDGISGFAPENSLIERDRVAQPLECPVGKVCVDGGVAATENMLGVRYRELLGRSNANGWRTLKAGQRAWESARRACHAGETPAACRIEVATMRLVGLDEYAIRGSGG